MCLLEIYSEDQLIADSKSTKTRSKNQMNRTSILRLKVSTHTCLIMKNISKHASNNIPLMIWIFQADKLFGMVESDISSSVF